MAGSRLEKFGSVYTRVRDLMRSGVMKPSQKPIWFDVYEAFPPKKEPLYVKPLRRFPKTDDAVPEIFYREDQIRAKFYEQFGTGPWALDLSKPNFVSTCQRFVEKYMDLESRSDLDEAALFEETWKSFLSEGIVLRRRGTAPVSAEPRDAALDLKLTDLLAEQQSAAADGADGADGKEMTDATHTP
ncbi:28S ribosomal protein S23, mitochondrial [Plectropomus leopardus]|uniref:28S ribosomal protein S23, mitochondrial n=1 Tax=Plectropomus leopardus TaxID=160734 RepID=UPI001C4D4ED4|nr:28S ribosomal protein S23, mitochondrial [Plectropomus leopardus]